MSAGEIVVNGVATALGEGASVADLVARLGNDRGIAVAVDGEVVPRAEWSSRRLAPGERVEIVTAVQGG